MYVLDAVPMLLALLAMSIGHPGRTLVGPDSEFPSFTRKEKKALKAERKARKAEMKAEKPEMKANAQRDFGSVVHERVDSAEVQLIRDGSFEAVDARNKHPQLPV